MEALDAPASLLALALLAALPARAEEGSPRDAKTPTGYLMVLRQSDDVIASPEKLAEQQQLPSASVTGMLCWAARPIANADWTPKLTADALLVGSLIAYRRGWRPTVLAVSLTAVALAALAWAQIAQQVVPSLH